MDVGELSIPKGHGIVRVAHNLRLHVTDPRMWSRTIGTDFWLRGGAGLVSAQATGGELLSDYGWTTTSLVETAATGGSDFLDSSDIGDATAEDHLLTNGSGDLLQSPSMFGSYHSAQGAASIMGRDPVALTAEWLGAMTIFSANENRSGWGFIEDGGSAATAADQLAFIHTDGTNFTIRSDADSDAGAADDATWHIWKIRIQAGSATDAVEWFIDSATQGTMDRKTDEWPASWGMHALTDNRPGLAWLHIFYE